MVPRRGLPKQAAYGSDLSSKLNVATERLCTTSEEQFKA